MAMAIGHTLVRSRPFTFESLLEQVSGGGSVGMAGAVMDALSVRGQSISSNGSGVSKASSHLGRDLSVRSEYVAPHVAAQSARSMTARSNTTRTRSKGENKLYTLGRAHIVFIRLELVLISSIRR